MRTERGAVIGITGEERGGAVLDVRSTTSDKTCDFNDKRRDGSNKGHPLARASGFTLIEIIVVVAIVAILSVVAVPTFGRFRRRAMTAEVHENLDKIAVGSAAYYFSDHPDATGALMPHQFPGKIAIDSASSDCCQQSGGICSGGPSRWTAAAWQALHFSIAGAHRYRYRYQSWDDDERARYRAIATGDLDCDGTTSQWIQQGWADVDTGIRLIQERIRPDDELE